MNDTYVTLQGWVGNDVEIREVRGATCASFRVGSTPRYRKDGAWVDGQTSWFTVNCWRTLGEHVGRSIRKGDAVVVHGRVRVDVWQREGQSPSTSWFVDANAVGHDLNRGTSMFVKAPKQVRNEATGTTPGSAAGAVPSADDRAVDEMLGAEHPEEPAA